MKINSIIGLLLTFLGVTMIFIVNRREFYRRNIAGIEEFSGYAVMVAVKGIEFVARYAGWMLIAIGFLIIMNKAPVI